VRLQEFFTCRKIWLHGTFRLYFPSERKLCCGFLSPLRIHLLGWVQNSNLWVQWQAHSIPGRNERILPLASVCRPTLGPTQPPVQWVPGVLSPGLKRGRSVTLTTHPHLVPRSRMSRNYTSSPPSPFVACSETALAFIYNITNVLISRNFLHVGCSEVANAVRTCWHHHKTHSSRR
jgi:hypothetical protein